MRAPGEREVDAVFERFKTPEELYNFKLGAALTMEHTVLKMLDSNAKAARSFELADLFRHHQDETRQQIANLEKAFAAFGGRSPARPAPPSRASRRRARPT